MGTSRTLFNGNFKEAPEFAPTQSLNNTDNLDPSSPRFSLRKSKPIPMPMSLQPSSVLPPVTRNINNPVFQSQGREPFSDQLSSDIQHSTIQVSIPHLEPEFTFIQILDLRELGDQKSMGITNENE